MLVTDPVLEPYEISFDGIQYTLVEKRLTEKGSPYTETHGYYTDLVFAIKKICQLEIAKKDSTDLKGFIEEWKKLMVKFKPLLYEN
jgi:hypothetical protein